MVENETPIGAPDADPRLQLVERIVSTPAFEKATRLQALLKFIVNESINGRAEQLSESNLGQQVFKKGPDYSPLIDSSVRVQMRQLRLKLHEYFDGPGRNEPVILEIPRGSYVPIFRTPGAPTSLPVEEIEEDPIQIPTERREMPRWLRWPRLRWIFLVAVSLVCAALARKIYLMQITPPKVPWPLSGVFDDQHVTRLILTDGAYQIVATANGSAPPLDDYLRGEPRNDAPINPADPYESRLMHALNGGTFTCFADAVAIASISEVVGRYKLNLDIVSARDLGPRALDGANFILIGSKSSNPWVGLYESKLNFSEEDDPAHPGRKRFLNRSPKPHELPYYEGSLLDNDQREDYVNIAVVRGLGDRGNAMIVEGLRHEGTEAAGRVLGSAELSSLLLRAFQNNGMSVPPRYFEALLETGSVAGIPHVSRVMAVRAY